jgi:hypothetical protein
MGWFCVRGKTVTWRGGFLEEAKFFIDFSVRRGREKCSGFRRKMNVKGGGGQECPLHQGGGGRLDFAQGRLCNCASKDL